jgi:hypothetical protein
MDTEPIAHEYDLHCSAERAFHVYVTRIGEWWHPTYSANPMTFEAVTIEPRVGGRVYATHTDVGDIVWGHVTVWDPPRRPGHSFTLAQSGDHPSILDRFAALANASPR